MKEKRKKDNRRPGGGVKPAPPEYKSPRVINQTRVAGWLRDTYRVFRDVAAKA